MNPRFELIVLEKPMVTCHLFHDGVLFGSSSILWNAAIGLVGHTDGSFLGEGPCFRKKK